MQHRAKPVGPGRHRITDEAPHTLRRELGRFTIITAGLAAGIGVAGFAATHVSPAAAHAPFIPPSPGGTTPVHSMATIDQIDDEIVVPGGALSFAKVQLKHRPVPMRQWVDPLPEAAVRSCFGERWGHLHAGVDLAAPDGIRIRAVGAGVVIEAGEAGGYGNAVLIDHGNGFLTHYGHLSVITVRIGQPVAAGEQIGNEGSTGHSTGPHLHFEVHQGAYKNPIEPTEWMHLHGVDIAGCVPLTG